MPIFTLAATALVTEFAITTFTVSQIASVLAITPTLGVAYAEVEPADLETGA
jgi:hypothetical protein